MTNARLTVQARRELNDPAMDEAFGFLVCFMFMGILLHVLVHVCQFLFPLVFAGINLLCSLLFALRYAFLVGLVFIILIVATAKEPSPEALKLLEEQSHIGPPAEQHEADLDGRNEVCAELDEQKQREDLDQVGMAL